jgi:hypothetical protein
MNNGIIQIITIVSALLGVIGLGILMVLGSGWARKRNAELNQETNCSQIEATTKALSEGNLPCFSKGFWAGSLSMVETVIGKSLALLVIVLLLVFLVFAFYSVLKVI